LKHKITAKCFIENLQIRIFWEERWGAAQARCNLVFFVQLCLVHEEKFSKDGDSYHESYSENYGKSYSEGYSEIYTRRRNITEGDETHICLCFPTIHSAV